MTAVALGVKRYARWRTWLALALVVALGGCRRTPPKTPPLNIRGPETEPVAVVDGQAVSLPLFNLLYESRRSSLPGDLGGDRGALDLKLTIAKQLADEYLVERAATRRGVAVSNKELDAAVAALAATFPSPAAFQRHVATYPQQAFGVRRTARLQLLREALTGMARSQPVTEAEARAYYQEHADLYHSPAHLRAFEIVIVVPAGATAKDIQERRSGAEDILRLARMPGAAFPALAQHFSEAPSRVSGGAMPSVTSQSVDPAIWRALNRLSPGQVSDVVEVKSGFSILKLLAREPATDVTFAQARPGIERTVNTQRRSARVSDLMQSLRRNARVDNLLERRYGALLTADVPNAAPGNLGLRGAIPQVVREGPTAAPGRTP